MAKAKTPASGGKRPTDTAKSDTKSDPKTSSTTKEPKASAKPAKAAAEKTSAQKATKGVPKVAKAADAKVVKTGEPVAKPEADTIAKATGASVEAAKEPKAKTPDPVGKGADPVKADGDTGKPQVTSPPPQPNREPERSGSGFWPLVLGGVVAGGLGFAAAEMNLFGLRSATPDLSPQIADLEQGQTGQEARIAALESATPETAEAPDLSGIQDNLSAISGTLDAFEARLAELEARPVATGEGPSGADDDMASELATLQDAIRQQKAEIDQLLSNAVSVEEATADAARKTALQAALTEITAAITNGAPFSEPVAALQASGVADLPAALQQAAEGGVPTLSALQSDYPDLARASLAAARASGSGEDGGGLSGFLKRQLGARSVAPREGSDPDAILSRAEDAVRNGDVARALNEMQSLPDEAKAPMADWIAAAQARADVEAAIRELSQRLSAN